MSIVQSIEVEGKRFVLVPAEDYQRICEDQAAAIPPLPPADALGNRPAAEFIAASIARDVMLQRRALGLSQHELAKLAGVRPETVSRLESGKHSPTVRTVEKIERALKRAAKRK